MKGNPFLLSTQLEYDTVIGRHLLTLIELDQIAMSKYDDKPTDVMHEPEKAIGQQWFLVVQASVFAMDKLQPLWN